MAPARASKGQEIRDAVLRRILEGKLKPGERLLELRLAAEFRTSQAPVREALRQLEALTEVTGRTSRGSHQTSLGPRSGSVPRRIASIAARLAFLPLLAACRASTEGNGTLPLAFDFRDVAPGWEAGFAHVAVSQEASVEFVADHRPLPEPLGPARKALYQSGWNVSDDLFMFFKHKVDGLDPGAEYDATFELGIVSNAHQGCDVGTAVSVMVKAGATPVEPQRVVVEGYYLMNVDTGPPAGGGSAALVLGDIRNGLPGCPFENLQYAEKTLSSGSATLPVRVAADGSLWLLLATDSAFESPHHLYFTAVTVTLRRR